VQTSIFSYSGPEFIMQAALILKHQRLTDGLTWKFHHPTDCIKVLTKSRVSLGRPGCTTTQVQQSYLL